MCEPGTKACTQCGIVKNFSEFSKSSRDADGLQDNCKACNKSISAAYRADNAEKEQKRHAKYQTENKPIINAGHTRWRKNNPDKTKAISRNYYKNNRDKELARRAAWVAKNPDWLRAYSAKARIKYETRLVRALVAWANPKKIAAIYREARRLTESTGVVHHVDHIVPLQSKVVCGLHCETNLQILTESENSRKSNKFIV